MTGQLPPSKFGRGYTYGGKDQPGTGPQGVPPATSPGPQPPSPAFGGSGYGGYQGPPTPQNPYVPPPVSGPYDPTMPYQSTPAPAAGPYGGWQAAPPTWHAAPQQSGYGPVGSAGTFLSSGEGAPKTAAILSIVGGLWAAVTVVQRWEQIKALFKFAKYASHLPTGSGYYYMVMLATIAEIVAIPLLLAAGVLLLKRNVNSLKAVMAGNGVVIAANLVLAFAINKVANAMTGAVTGVMSTVDSIANKWHINSSHLDNMAGALNNRISSLSAQFIVIHLLLPLLLAIVAIVLARSAASRLWLERGTGYGP